MKHSLILLAVCCLPADGSSQEKRETSNPPSKQADNKPKAKTVIHQTDAGKLDASGWCQASSSDGHLSASFPALYNEYSITTPGMDGSVVTMRFLEAKSNGVKYQVMHTALRGKKLRKGALESTEFEKTGTVTDKEELTLGTLKGIGFKTTGRKYVAWIRKYATETDLYALVVEVPVASLTPEVEKDAKHFLESFRIEPPMKR